jgi:predicted nucleotide-binding protein (sugar kinase/HSP70/actin superfamily)
MNKHEAYEKAALENLSDGNGMIMDIIYRAMDIYADNVREALMKECKRVKIQRNEYEIELRKAHKEIMKLRAELKLKVVV